MASSSSSPSLSVPMRSTMERQFQAHLSKYDVEDPLPEQGESSSVPDEACPPPFDDVIDSDIPPPPFPTDNTRSQRVKSFFPHMTKTFCFCFDVKKAALFVSGFGFFLCLWNTLGSSVFHGPFRTVLTFYQFLSAFIVLWGIRAITTDDVRSVRIYCLWFVLNCVVSIIMNAFSLSVLDQYVADVEVRCGKNSLFEGIPMDCKAFAQKLKSERFLSLLLGLLVQFFFIIVMAQLGLVFHLYETESNESGIPMSTTPIDGSHPILYVGTEPLPEPLPLYQPPTPKSQLPSETITRPSVPNTNPTQF